MITHSQQSHILHYCCKARVSDTEKLYTELEKLTKRQASQVMSLFKAFKHRHALMKLKEFKVDV